MHENALYHGQAGFLLEYCDRGDLINVIKPITNFKICNSYLSGHKACDANSTATKTFIKKEKSQQTRECFCD